MRQSRLHRPGRRSIAIVATFIVVEGLASARIGYPSFDFRHSVVVLATGWVVASCGLVAWVRVPSSRTGPLLVLTAVASFLGGFRWVAFDPLAELFSALALVYAAVATHAILAFPAGRPQSRAFGAAIVAAYLAALLPVPRADLLVAIALGAGLVASMAGGRRTMRDRGPAVAAGVVFAVVLGGYRLVPVAGLAGPLDTRPLLQAALITVAAVLCVALIRLHQRPRLAGDLVVELGSGSRPDLARGLADLIGDPGLQVGFRIQPTGGYVDAAGRPIATPAPESGRIATPIEPKGEPIAILVHRADVGIDPEISVEVTRAAALAASNARLQAQVRAQLADVRASRRRLLAAGDDERSELERRLRDGLEPRFAALEQALTSPGRSTDEVAATALDQLRDTRAELVELARGIHPLAIDGRGLEGALSDLASRARVPVDLEIQEPEVPSRATQTAILFIAGEALANVAKHANAARTTVRVDEEGGTITLEVTDNGRGGVDPSRGTGLRGIRDRVEALGGRLTIDSRPGSGTRLRAVLPLEDPAW